MHITTVFLAGLVIAGTLAVSGPAYADRDNDKPDSAGSAPSHYDRDRGDRPDRDWANRDEDRERQRAVTTWYYTDSYQDNADAQENAAAQADPGVIYQVATPPSQVADSPTVPDSPDVPDTPAVPDTP